MKQKLLIAFRRAEIILLINVDLMCIYGMKTLFERVQRCKEYFSAAQKHIFH